MPRMSYYAILYFNPSAETHFLRSSFQHRDLQMHLHEAQPPERCGVIGKAWERVSKLGRVKAADAKSGRRCHAIQNRWR